MRKCKAIKNRSQLEARHTKRIESRIRAFVSPEEYKSARRKVMRGSILQWWQNYHSFIERRIKATTL